MAVFLANTMHKMIFKSSSQEKSMSFRMYPAKKPIKANGIANIVWLNFTSDKKLWISRDSPDITFHFLNAKIDKKSVAGKYWGFSFFVYLFFI